MRKSIQQSGQTQKPLKTARIKLILKNRRLAAFYATKFPGWGAIRGFQDNEERFQVASLGLCLAAIRFDKTKGSFQTYSLHWVRNSLQKYCTSDHPVYIPIYRASKMVKIISLSRKLAIRKGEEKALQFLTWATERYNLHNLWTLVSHGKIYDEIEDYRNNSSINVEHLERMKLLSDREQLVIRHRYGINTQERTLDYIAANMMNGISRERVRQIEASAIRKLRGEQ